MSYYNPKIYNKEHLPEAIRAEMQKYFNIFMRSVDKTLSEMTEADNPSMLDRVRNEDFKEFAYNLKINLSCDFGEMTVKAIDNEGGEPLEELEEYTQWCDAVPLPKGV